MAGNHIAGSASQVLFGPGRVRAHSVASAVTPTPWATGAVREFRHRAGRVLTRTVPSRGFVASTARENRGPGSRGRDRPSRWRPHRWHGPLSIALQERNPRGRGPQRGGRDGGQRERLGRRHGELYVVMFGCCFMCRVTRSRSSKPYRAQSPRKTAFCALFEFRVRGRGALQWFCPQGRPTVIGNTRRIGPTGGTRPG